MLPRTWVKMKNLVANASSKRPIVRALFSLMPLMLMGSIPALANEEAQNSDNSFQGECELTEHKQEMLSLINEARSQSRQCGNQQFVAVDALAWSCRLEAAAQSHSQDMAKNNYFSHTGPEGVGIQQRVTSHGYEWQAVGENIAAGHASASAVVNGWLESPGHCRNIMSDAFTEMGMAEAHNSESKYSTYWTKTLGNPR